MDAHELPAGFRFHPTDEELVLYYLARKIQDPWFRDRVISEADLNKCEPWELPGKATTGEKEWYFYSLKDRKYPTGMRTNRATESGYWKATGKDRQIWKSGSHHLVGLKKTLVFYTGRAPKGVKTNWVMHEYRSTDGSSRNKTLVTKELMQLPKSAKDEWILCRVFCKSPAGKKLRLDELGYTYAKATANKLLSSVSAETPACISGLVEPCGFIDRETSAAASSITGYCHDYTFRSALAFRQLPFSSSHTPTSFSATCLADAPSIYDQDHQQGAHSELVATTPVGFPSLATQQAGKQRSYYELDQVWQDH